MMVGYAMVGQDNCSDILDLDDKGMPICSKCGYIIDTKYISPGFKLVKKTYDVSYTYDGRCIVSTRFKEFCADLQYKGLEFQPLLGYTKFYVFYVNNIVKIDTERQHIDMENCCTMCHNCEYVTPGFPTYIEPSCIPLKDGFYSTDISFGSRNSKSPIIVVALETYRKIKAEKFKGLVFIEIME